MKDVSVKCLIQTNFLICEGKKNGTHRPWPSSHFQDFKIVHTLQFYPSYLLSQNVCCTE